MPRIYPNAYFEDGIVSIDDAKLSIACSAVLYGLSVYTVFPVIPTAKGPAAFRLNDHFDRLINSAKIIGIDTFETEWTLERFKQAVHDVVEANSPIKESVFVRATVHVNGLVPGTKSKGLATVLSIFLYEAKSIMPVDGARLKVSSWRRVSDTAIPSRAKVNGAYVNSVLGKQDAINSGYDDCIFLNSGGHVAELSAANIFLVRDGILITPDVSSDILEGISRMTVIEIARNLGIPVIERSVDLTELYIADEAFACGTSSGIAFIKEIDGRKIGSMSGIGPITKQLKDRFEKIFSATDHTDGDFAAYMTLV
jgi:branched-chain amino acid aminotransferase